MLHQLIAHLLVEVRAAVAQLRQAQQNVLDEVEAVDIILHAHIKRCGDGALLPVAANVQVAVMTAVGQLMNERRVAVSALIPIALANYYPTVCMLGEGSSGILLYIAGACVILGVIDVLVWKKGMKAYQSTGA